MECLFSLKKYTSNPKTYLIKKRTENSAARCKHQKEFGKKRKFISLYTQQGTLNDYSNDYSLNTQRSINLINQSINTINTINQYF